MARPDPHHPDVDASQRRWLEQRRYLNRHRYRLAQLASQLYRLVPQTHGLLTSDSWIAPEPIPVDEVTLHWADEPPTPTITGTGLESAATRPLATPGHLFSSYAAAMGQLAPPAVFENRLCYRLTNIATANTSPQLTFTIADYFDIIDTCEAVAHELASEAGHAWPDPPGVDVLPFRRTIGDPRDLTTRAVIPAASVLTIRRSATDGPTLILHRRDAAKVAHGGGLYQVIPVGVFQPTDSSPRNQGNDFDLWRFIAREYEEELLNVPEIAGQADPIDYDAWPFYQALQKARQTGDLRVFWLGLGMDPLSLVTDFLMVAVFDEAVYDDVFHHLASTNAEGDLVNPDQVERDHDTVGIPFNQDTIAHLTGAEPMQAAGAALLSLAWRHRNQIID